MSGKKKDDRWIVESWEADEVFGLQDMAREEIYEIPSEVSHKGESTTKRNSQLEKEEIYDNPITKDLKDDVMEEDEAFESSGPEDANEPTMDFFRRRGTAGMEGARAGCLQVGKRWAEALLKLGSDEDEEEERAPLSEEEKKKQEEEELKKKMEEEDQPDLENGLCAFMRLMDRVVRIPASQLVTYSPEAQEFLKLGDFLFDSVEFNNVTLSKEAVTLATTFMHKVQLYELSQREVFVKSRTIWYPISSEHIGALIYMLSRIKCPRITPDCFEEAEQLIRKYCSDAHWEPVWSSIKERNINQQYRIEYTGRLPLFEVADFFAEDHYNDDSFYWNTHYRQDTKMSKRANIAAASEIDSNKRSRQNQIGEGNQGSFREVNVSLPYFSWARPGQNE
ncbi:Protein CBG07482 [Caenorhabditis briggsae]|uniref:Protein CBG07482 n=1 Tax=Caenorhabditis briggsae TaxID=6238 RepID=A8X4P2_CAEBR|nr:Protein CBG07482 [Caenorhabditis briggsae]CAP27602.1 Protein CBG07482 [Caenorhabditis briggsae]